MNYQLSDYLVMQVVSFLQRVYRYNSQWLNSDIEVVQVPSGSTLQIFEVYSEEAEKYPSVSVGSMGGNFQHLSFNNVLSSNQYSQLPLGERALTTVRIDGTSTLAVELPASDIQNLTLRGIGASYMWTGVGVGGDNIQATLYRDYTTSPVQVASASLPGCETVAFQQQNAEFSSYPVMSGSDYWIVFSSTADSPYDIGIDTSFTSTRYRSITGGVSTQASGSVTGYLTLPQGLHIGGAYNSSIGIRVRAKNSSKLARQIAELSAQYCEYAKHAFISRQSSATHGMQSTFLDSGVAEFTKKGIFIRETRVGQVESTPRGQNDNIFSILITLDCFTQWEEFFSGQTLIDTPVEISTFT